MNFFRNGTDLGVAYQNFNISDGLWPAATVAKQQGLTFNFGKTPLRYPHPSSEYRLIHCNLSETDLANLNKIFNEYKGIGISLSESGETGDLIKGRGMLQYGTALDVTDDNDPGLLVILWKLGARAQWELTRDEFVGGWTALGCGRLDGMKQKLQAWRRELDDVENFRKFYFWVFDYLREEGKTILLMEEATTVWAMLSMDKKWKLWNKWLEYIAISKAKSISKDTWRQFYDFIKTHPAGLDGYDDMGSWPVLIDEFVIWSKTGKLHDDDS